MFRLFRKIDDFLTMYEEYVEQRVWNGKFIYDVAYFQSTKSEATKEAYDKQREEFLNSERYKNTVAFLKHLWELILQIPILAETLKLIGEGLRICAENFAHYLFILIVGFWSAIFLLNTFEASPITVSILFIPILLGNHLLLSAFFYMVDKKEHKTKINFLDALKQIRPTVKTNSFVFILQLSIMASFGTLFLGFSSFLSFIFGVVNIDWSSSFLYWMPVIMVGLILLIILYLILLIVGFSYIFIILEKKSAKEAINQSWQYIQNTPRHSTIFYIILSALTFIDIVNKTAGSNEGGFVTSVFSASHAFFFLGFLLRRKYFEKDVKPAINIYAKNFPPLPPFIGFGLLSYIAVAAFSVQQAQPQLLKIIEQRRQATIIKLEYILYTNKDSDYAIDYPKNWTIYRWSDHSVTIHTKDNGTDAGNIRVDIDVHPEGGERYQQFYNANPGLVTYDTGSKNVTTKIANIKIQDEKAVKYTYAKVEGKVPEYQTHYLIQHNQKFYDISFVIGNKNYEENYRNVFDTMIGSFQFLK